MRTHTPRALALELVRVTESAALAAARLMGRGDTNAVDQAAVDAMRRALASVNIDGLIVIGEGAKDRAPMLHCGESVGTGDPPQLDVAVDPVDGTRALAKGGTNTISAIAASPRGTMFDPGSSVYMNKLAAGPIAKGKLDIVAPVASNLENLARAKKCEVRDLTVVILDRPRHDKLVSEVRACGARIRLIQECDIAAALMTCWEETGIDLLLGIGGGPEAVLAACALRALGGELQCQSVLPLRPTLSWTDEYELSDPLDLDDLVSSDDVLFAATGVADGELLPGVEYFGGGAVTESLVIRGLTGTVRRVRATHRLDKLEQLSDISY
jgi:fructose-1,6-bisphosphatase II